MGAIVTKVQINIIVGCLPEATWPDGKGFTIATKATNANPDAIGNAQCQEASGWPRSLVYLHH